MAENNFAGKSIGDLNIRSRTGASIVGHVHQGEFKPNPGADLTFSRKDIVAVIGNAEARETFKKLVAPPSAGISGYDPSK